MSRTTSFGLLAAAAVSAFVFVACGSSSDTTPVATGGTAGTAGKGGTAGTVQGGAGGQAGGEQGGTAGTAGTAGDAGAPTNVDCANAEPMKLGTASTGYLFPKGTKLAYSIDLKADEWVVMSTVANAADATTNYVDTIITVYDANNKQIAYDDDGVPRATSDSELLFHNPVDQKLCLVVEDLYTSMGETHPGYATSKAKAKFTLTVGDLDPTKATLDKEPNNDGAGAQAVNVIAPTPPDTASIAYVGGVLNPDTDVDVFSFTMPAGVKTLSMSVMPKGLGTPADAVSGFGSTILPGSVEFSDKQGKVFARIDPSKYPFQGGSSYFDISVPVAESTDVLMWVKRPAGAALGSNDFYFVKQMMSTASNDPEMETTSGANDTIATAELGCDTAPEGGTCTFKNQSTTAGTVSYFIMGHINPATDIDYIGLQAKSGDTFSLACSSLRDGSGLIAPNYSFRDSTDKELQAETETADAQVAWFDGTTGSPSKPAVAITADGWYYVRISATGQDPNVSGNYYICGLHVVTP